LTVFSRPAVVVSVSVLVLNLLILAQAAISPIELSASAQTGMGSAQIDRSFANSVKYVTDPGTGRDKALIGSIGNVYQTSTEEAASAED